MTKNTKQAKATPKAKPAKTQKGLDLTRMTQGYFYPDILNAGLDMIKIPTVSELAFLGWFNVSSIRSYFRDEEEKLKKMHFSLLKESARLDTCVQELKTQSNCDWHGFGYGRLKIKELQELTPAERRKIEEQRSKLVCACRFGRDVAEWCEKAPSPQCNFMRNDSMTDAIPIVETVGTEEIPVISQLNSATGVSSCPSYNICRKDQPFLDEPCVLANPEKRTVCKRYLQEKLEDTGERLRIVRKYMHNLTKAGKSDRSGKRPAFFDGDSYVGSGKARLMIIFQNTPEGLICSMAVRKLAAPDLKGKMPIIVQQFTPEGIVDEVVKREGCANKLYMTADDFLYLVKHTDFRQVWLEMSLFYGKSFSKEDLATFFSQFDGMVWPNTY